MYSIVGPQDAQVPVEPPDSRLKEVGKLSQPCKTKATNGAIGSTEPVLAAETRVRKFVGTTSFDLRDLLC